MKLSKEQRDHLLVTFLMTVMVVVAMWMLLIGPIRTSLGQLKGEVQSSKDALADARGLVARASQIDLEVQAVAKFLGKLEEHMVDGDPNLWIRLKVDEFQRRKEYNVTIPTIGSYYESDIGLLPDFPYKGVVFTVQGSAFYHDLGRFIADFENAFPLIRVQNLSLQPDVTAGEFGPNRERLTFSFELVVPLKPTETKS